MAILLLMMALENANNNGGSTGGPVFRNRPAVAQRADGSILRFLARPFRRNR